MKCNSTNKNNASTSKGTMWRQDSKEQRWKNWDWPCPVEQENHHVPFCLLVTNPFAQSLCSGCGFSFLLVTLWSSHVEFGVFSISGFSSLKKLFFRLSGKAAQPHLLVMRARKRLMRNHVTFYAFKITRLATLFPITFPPCYFSLRMFLLSPPTTCFPLLSPRSISRFSLFRNDNHFFPFIRCADMTRKKRRSKALWTDDWRLTTGDGRLAAD